MRQKRMRIWLIGGGLLLGAAACGQKPEEAADEYLKALAAGEAAKAHAMAVPEDQAALSPDELAAEVDPARKDALHKAFDPRATYQILSTEKQDDRAQVKVRHTVPDYAKMKSDRLLLAKAMSKAGDDKAKEQELFEQFIIEKFQAEGPPLRSEEATLALVKMEKKWRVATGWKAQKAKAEAEARAAAEKKARQVEVMGHIQRARKAMDFLDFDTAVKAYEAAQAVWVDHPEIGPGLERVRALQQEFATKKPNLEKIHVEKFKSEIVKRRTGRPDLRVAGTVINDSPLSYRSVTLAVDLLDDQGQPVRRDRIRPWNMDALASGETQAKNPFEPKFRHDFRLILQDMPQGFSGKTKVTAVDYVEAPKETLRPGKKKPAGPRP